MEPEIAISLANSNEPQDMTQDMNMTKWTICLLTLGLASLAHGSAQVVSAKYAVTADHAGGYYVVNEKKNPYRMISDCLFGLSPTDWSDHTKMVIGLNSRSGSPSNMAVQIPRDMLPLKDGLIFSYKFGMIEENMTYEKGILEIVRTRTSETERDVQFIETMQLKVTPELDQILEGSVLKVSKAGSARIQTVKMLCSFSTRNQINWK